MIKKVILCVGLCLNFFLTTGIAVEPGYIHSYTKRIILQTGDIFVLGGRNSNVSFSSHGFWHNGSYIKIAERARLNSMHVQGNRVYIVGKLRHQAALWAYKQTEDGWIKDHILMFAEGELFDVKAKSTEGKHTVYASGVLDEREKMSRCTQPYLWTIEHHPLTDQFVLHKQQPLFSNGSRGHYPLRLFLQKDKVIIGGMIEIKFGQQNAIVVWQDDWMQKVKIGPINVYDAIWNGNQLITAGSVFGKGREQAAYWIGDKEFRCPDSFHLSGMTLKNGKPLMVGHDTDGSDFYWYQDKKVTILKPARGNEVYAVVVDGEDMYITGRMNDYRPYYSKNGKLVKLYFGPQDTWE